MNRVKATPYFLVLGIAFFLISKGFAADYPTTPRLKDNGKKHNIVYLQGGPYYEYDMVFNAVIRALMEIGWAERINLPAQSTNTARDLYTYLAAHKEWSKYLEFPADGFYDNDWKENKRQPTMQKLLKRQDVDMIFAYGTWAGQDMKNMPPEFKHIPVVVMDVSDPLRSKIVDSNEDTGRDNLTARVDPLRYQRQVSLFHQIIGFKKLGMAFEDTVEGRSYSAIADVEKVSREQNFEVVQIRHPGYVKSKKQAVQWFLQSVTDLASKVDAFYITQQLAVDLESLPKIVQILNSHKIPTFSQAGSSEVQGGVLLSIATAGFKYVAKYHATKIAKILNGAKPRKLPILFEDPPKIAINLETASQIGFDPPVDILSAADEVYMETTIK
jgi:ABC-type uncharacterized transport system substrate-binding protein